MSVTARPASSPTPVGYRDFVVYGPPDELDMALDELELTDGYVGSSRRLLIAGGDVAVKVRLRDDGTLPLSLSATGRLPAVSVQAPVTRAEPGLPPLRAHAAIERPAPGSPAYRATNLPWWHDSRALALAGLATAVVLGVVALVVWVVVSVIRAGVQVIAEHGTTILGALALAAVGWLIYRLLTRSRGGGCGGLHCTGCSRH